MPDTLSGLLAFGTLLNPSRRHCPLIGRNHALFLPRSLEPFGVDPEVREPLRQLVAREPLFQLGHRHTAELSGEVEEGVPLRIGAEFFSAPLAALGPSPESRDATSTSRSWNSALISPSASRSASLNSGCPVSGS